MPSIDSNACAGRLSAKSARRVGEHFCSSSHFHCGGWPSALLRGLRPWLLQRRESLLFLSDYGITTHGYTLFAHEDTIRNEPKLVRRFLRASLKGLLVARSKPEVGVGALLSRAPHLKTSTMKRRISAYNDVTSAFDPHPPGFMSRKMFKETYDRLQIERVISKPVDLDATFTTRFVEQTKMDLRGFEP